jgi:hypothetical protein
MAPIERPDWGSGGALVPAGGSELDIAGDDSGILADLDAGFHSPEVESRYRTMVAGRMERQRLAAGAARDLLPALLVAEWERSGGVEIRLAEAQKAAIGILEGLHADDRMDFVQGFDALPDGARSSVLLELSLGSTGSVRRASEEDVARFAETDEGRALVAEWGERASRNVAVALGRVKRIAERLSVADATLLDEWFKDLPPRSLLAALRILVAR